MRRPTMQLTAAAVVDSHPLMRTAIADALRRGGFDVVACEGALADLRHPISRNPAVFVVGWEATGPRDLAGLRRISASAPPTKVVVLAPSAEDSSYAFAAGAAAVILKTIDPDDLAPVVRQIVGETIIGAAREREEPDPFSSPLTAREKEVLSRVANGASNGTVASQLWLSETTIKFHLRNIYRKLEVNGRMNAARKAQELGLIPLSQVL